MIYVHWASALCDFRYENIQNLSIYLSIYSNQGPREIDIEAESIKSEEATNVLSILKPLKIIFLESGSVRENYNEGGSQVIIKYEWKVKVN